MWILLDYFIAHERRFTVLDCVVGSLDRLWPRHPDEVYRRLNLITKKTGRAPATHDVHDGVTASHFFEFLRTGRKESGAYLQRQLKRIAQPTAGNALAKQVGTCRSHKWFIANDPGKPDARHDAMRARTWTLVGQILQAGQNALAAARARFEVLFKDGTGESAEAKKVKEEIKHLNQLVDDVGHQLFFASGAFEEKQQRGDNYLTPAQTQRFWEEARPILTALANEPHPHTSYHLVQTLHHLCPCAPREIFLLAARSIQSASAGGMHHDHLAVTVVVALIQQVLADHREIFRSQPGETNDCLTALLEVLDLFVEAGWTEARQLTNRLEEIYR